MGLFEQFPYTNFHELNLDWIIGKVKEFNTRLDTIQETVTEAANAYTDSQVLQIKADFAQLEADFAAFELDINNQFSKYTAQQTKAFTDYQTLVNAQITVMRGEIDQAKTEMLAALDRSYEYTDVQIAKITTSLPDLITQAIPKGRVYNILTATYMTIQNMFDYLCALHNPNAIICSEVTSRANTCTQIAGYSKTCTEFLQNGNNIILQK